MCIVLPDSEPPYQNLYLYDGVPQYESSSNDRESVNSVLINKLLLRSCSVRNTAWVIGLTIYMGADTEIMLNGGDTRFNRSKIVDTGSNHRFDGYGNCEQNV